MAHFLQLNENEEDSRKAAVSRLLGGFERISRRLEKADCDWQTAGLVANGCPSLADKTISLKGVTIDASIWTKEAVSCRVGLYKLRHSGREVLKYFHQSIHMNIGDAFGWADKWGGFALNLSRDTDMAVMDYGEVEIVKEAVLDLQFGGSGASDCRRIKWDVMINGGAGDTVEHDSQGFPRDALYMFSYHLNYNAKISIYYGSMLYFSTTTQA